MMASLTGSSSDGTAAVVAINDSQEDTAGPGLLARSRAAAVIGESTTWMGVFGQSLLAFGVNGRGVNDASGVGGESDNGAGVIGATKTGPAGVFGHTDGAGNGVRGVHDGSGVGVFGGTLNGIAGVFGQTEGEGAAVRGQHDANGLAGFFAGHVGVTRDLRVDESIHAVLHVHVGGNVHVKGDVQLEGADLAEEFEVEGDGLVEPGCVVVATGDDVVTLGGRAYDRRVAGVVSGAGAYRPGLVLHRKDAHGARRWPVALAGKVWCRVDADLGAIEIGDPLTSSSTPGHAMRADDPTRAFGAVLGKALGRLPSGRGLVPILVTLQ